MLTLENRLVSGCLAPQARKNITLSCVSKENRVFLICVFYLYSLFRCLPYAIGRPKSSFSNFREHSKLFFCYAGRSKSTFSKFRESSKKTFLLCCSIIKKTLGVTQTEQHRNVVQRTSPILRLSVYMIQDQKLLLPILKNMLFLGHLF